MKEKGIRIQETGDRKQERRDRLAQSIKEALEEYKHGEFKKGTIEDLLRDLEK